MCHPQAVTQYHIGQLNIGRLLTGANCGHARRWATDFYEKHSDSTEPCIMSLGEHLDFVTAALKVGGLPNMKTAEPQGVNADLKKLDEGSYGSGAPTSLKMFLFERHLKQLSENGDFDLYMHCCCPWRLTSESDEPFSLASPKLVDIEGSPADRGNTFLTKLISLFTALVRRGRPGHKELLRAVDTALTFLQSNQAELDSDGEGQNEEDSYDEALDFVMKTGKALKLLVVVGTESLMKSHISSCKTLSDILQAKDSRVAKNDQTALAWKGLSKDINKDADYYAKQAEDFTKHRQAYEKHVPSMTDFAQMCEDAKLLEDGQLNPLFHNGLKTILMPAVAELPAASSTHWEQQGEKVFEKVCRLISDTLAGKQTELSAAVPAIDLVNFEKALNPMVQDMMTTFPSLRPLCDKIKAAMTAKRNQMVQGQLCEALASQMGHFIVDGMARDFTADDFNALQKMQGNMDLLGDVPSSMPSDFVSKVGLVGIAAAAFLEANVDEISKHMPTVEGLRNHMAAGTQKDALGMHLKALSLCVEISGYQSKWEGLGETLGDRAKHASGEPTLRSWLSAISSCAEQESLVGCSSALSDLVESCKTEIEKIWDHMLEAHVTSMRNRIAAGTQHLQAAKWPLEGDDARASWEQFLKSGEKTWLGYMSGDQMRHEQAMLRDQIAEYKKIHDIFGKAMDEGMIKASELVVNKIEACVFSVKTIRAIDKNSDYEMKLKRYCISRKKRLEEKDMAEVTPWVPVALVDRLQEIMGS